ncbi:ankyrin repeat protein, partial [Ancylostoma caninum]
MLYLFNFDSFRTFIVLFQRNIGFTANFECVYPASKENMLSNRLLLTGIAGDANAFFQFYFKGVHMKDDTNCYDDCICLSVSPREPNVLHFAAAHGNAQFIKKILFPEKALPDDPVVRNHYANMMFCWSCSAIECSGTKMYPFDVAVFYDFKDCAREFLGYCTCAKMLRERKIEMTRVRSSLPLREYIESPLSMAVYHGNMEMVRMLLYWQLIKPQHFPQAFREAANAGDIAMLGELWQMCGRDLNLVTEQDPESQGICTPLHVAAAAGQLRAVQFLCCLGEGLRTKPDAAGDLPLTYAIENGHMAIVDFLMKTYRTEVRHTVIRSAIACKRNKLAKLIFHDMLNLREVIDEVRPLKFAVDVENFHCAEYFLKQYMNEKKASSLRRFSRRFYTGLSPCQVGEWPWANDISEALEAVLRCRTLSPEQKTKFVIAFQLAGVK